jgi:hypothetical protein
MAVKPLSATAGSRDPTPLSNPGPTGCFLHYSEGKHWILKSLRKQILDIAIIFFGFFGEIRG